MGWANDHAACEVAFAQLRVAVGAAVFHRVNLTTDAKQSHLDRTDLNAQAATVRDVVQVCDAFVSQEFPEMMRPSFCVE